VIALIALPAHPVLCNEHEGRNQHTLQRYDERQQAKRVRVEPQRWRREAVPCDPGDHGGRVDGHEHHRADDIADRLSHALAERGAPHRLPFDLDDGLDIFGGGVGVLLTPSLLTHGP
jgi:hypothetical protein